LNAPEHRQVAVVQSGGALAMQEDELLHVLQSSLYPGAALSSIKMVLGYCKAAGLDPMQKPVHIVPMWDSKAKQMRDVVMPGVGLYRTQASRGGCAGISEPEFGPDVTASIGGQQITYPAWCRVTVKRRQQTGEVDEFTAREFWMENYAVKGGQEKSVAPNAMWTKRPYGQLAKCAEAQALRKGFPEIGNQPTAEEMEGKELHYEDAPSPPPAKPALPDYPTADFEKNLPAWTKAVASGKKTAGSLLAMLQTKAQFSEEQKAVILSLKAAAVEDAKPVDPAAPAHGEHADFIAAMEGGEE
jgi:phage recombination protein Bet